MPRAYYNEFDPYAAEWLRNLIAAGHIAPGDVDQRSIEDVRPSDLAGFTQCHFFAGVGVWSLALRRAGWPDSRPVWTGSCPCQPFSAAGKGNGFADERHLWPAWFHLIGQRSPVVVFGEQVSSKDADIWVDLVQTDMEALGYAFGAVPFPSAGVGAPHIRDRLYWLADSNEEQRGRRANSEGLQSYGQAVERNEGDRIAQSNSTAYGMDNTNDAGLEGLGSEYQTEGGRVGEVRPVAPASESCRVEYTTGDGREQRGTESGWGSITAGCTPSGMADADSNGCAAAITGSTRETPAVSGINRATEPCARESRGAGGTLCNTRPSGPVNGRWSDADWLFCRDGKWRPVEPGTFPLANGAPARVGRLRSDEMKLTRPSRVGMLRAYGNAINAEAAQTFIETYLECQP